MSRRLPPGGKGSESGQPAEPLGKARRQPNEPPERARDEAPYLGDVGFEGPAVKPQARQVLVEDRSRDAVEEEINGEDDGHDVVDRPEDRDVGADEGAPGGPSEPAEPARRGRGSRGAARRAAPGPRQAAW